MPRLLCAFGCGAESSRQQEHVLPQHVLRRYEPDLFTTTIGGVVQRRATGDERTTDSLIRWKLPACIGCNSWLERTYEDPAKGIVAALLDHDHAGAQPAPVLDADQTAHFARWAVKTMLLGQHPQTRRLNAGKATWPTDPWPLDEALLRTWRTSGVLPEGLRLWIARAHDERGYAEMQHELVAVIPPTAWATWLGFGTAGGGALTLCLDWRMPRLAPHPLAVAGLARQLWPRVPASFALADLPVLSARGHQQYKRGLIMEESGQHHAASTAN